MELILGIIGMALILIGFLLNQTGRFKREDLSYDVINLIGAGLLALYAYLISSWPFLILNLIWTAFSFKDVIVDLMPKKGKR